MKLSPTAQRQFAILDSARSARKLLNPTKAKPTKSPTLLSWIARPFNAKTGSIPTAYCGQSLRDMKATCEGCALLNRTRIGNDDDADEFAQCYSWNGTPTIGFMSMARAATADRSNHNMKRTAGVKAGGRYSLSNALAKRRSSARAARIGALGDPSGVERKSLWSAVRAVRKAGLSVLSYTHMWRAWRNRGLKTCCLASCESTSQADHAIAEGWIPAAIVPSSAWSGESTVTTPGGASLVVCPAQRRDATTCNDCRFCDPAAPIWRAGKVKGVAFVNHNEVKSL